MSIFIKWAISVFFFISFRYFAICKPLSFAMHSQKAKLVLYSTVVLAFLLMLPALFMYGTRTVQFDNGLIGCTCYIRDLYYLTEWHVLFRTFQFLLNLTLFVIISLLYISVYKTVHKRIRAPSNPSLHSPQTVAPPKGLFRQRSSKRRKVSPAPDNVPSIRIDAGDTRKKPSVSSVSSVELNIQIREICKNKEAKEKGSRRRRRRNDSSRNFLGLAILCGGCIPCKEAKRRESVTPMVHSISRAESTSSQDDRNHSVASAPASMCHDYECEDMHLEPSPIKKISDSVLTKQMDSASARQLQEMSTLNLFTAKKVGQTSERGNGEKENNIHEEEDSLASPKLKNKRNSDFVEHTNAIKMGDDNSSKRSPRSKNKFNLTLPSADRHSIYQAGMMVGKMRRISLPATYRQNSTEETKAYLSEAALNQYQKTRYKTAMILLTVTVVFLLTWTPFWILHVVVYVDNDFWDNQTYTEQNIFRMLRYMYMINHAINPVIYAFAHKQFRDDMKTVFKKICCRSRY